MGYLYYGSDTQAISMPDRMLAHVKVLAATKLRRNESFTITWRHTDDEAPGRTTLWLHPAIPLRFTFSTVDAEKIDGPLLQRLAAEASSSGGLNLDARMFEASADPVAVPVRELAHA
ncbi:hypothetical protein QSU92_08065 [Microbacterium sp. ET2]|uniref:DUF7882 family protein n=1 Tax=Microbacterium albipurpureum TaxID=3050384 RepID=UPI00259CC586|nr:hypothetical protein [Microbacterium sp. ET2 (Ac-2212)]WJL97104.1 hypothetical protein QSU92_08065 [Microbacterium sp. ET2 (Ac-2212)]